MSASELNRLTALVKRENGRHQPGILCLSHLGWDYVWQRPQQILSRLASRHPILYVNEPEIDPTSESLRPVRLEPVSTFEQLRAWQPIFSDYDPVYDNWRAIYAELVTLLLLCEGWITRQDGRFLPLRPLILWFYTPLPHYLLDQLPADVVVYDVMDNLATFKGAAADLPQREGALLKRADVVFAGGKSMYEARRGRHHNLHLFPSGVEQEHFAQAAAPGTLVADELAELDGVVLGYFGAIDERIDMALLEQIACTHPEWTIVMIGPVVKIEASELPRQPNIHYLGKQPYERLPEFLKRFDVCLMPFALNEATHAISPTKTLEYMAAHKPIVSTAVPDVVNSWADVVYIAEDRSHYLALVEQALEDTPQIKAARYEREQQYLADNSWERIVADMERHILKVVDQITVH